MLMKDIKISGWHSFNGQWRCVFRDFSNDELCSVLPEFLVECDLRGYSTYALANVRLSRILDIPFDSIRMNVKHFRDMQEPAVPEDPIAQVLSVFDMYSHCKYMYLSMTNFEFWAGATEQLLNEFGRPNIGGFMIAVGHCKVVDYKLRGALQL